MANLSNINNKFIVTDGGNVLIGNTANSSGRLQIKDTQTSNFNDGLAITRNNAAQTGYINMVGGAFNFNSPGLSYKFRNNGTQTLELNSSGNATFTGNVGIGAAASDGNLHVRKTGINTGITNVLMNANFADGSNGTGLSIGYRTDETTAVLAARTATGNIAFYSYDGGWSESMRITNTGNVGIGTASPDTPLHVITNTSGYAITIEENSGSEAFQIGVDSVGSLDFFNTKSATSHLSLIDNGNSYFSGNVGIGTSDIEETLTIAKTDGGDGTIVGLRSDASFSQFELVTKNSQVDWGLQTVGARNMYFTTNGSEKMRIDSNGSVSFAGTSTLSNTAASIQHYSPNGYLYIYGGTGGIVIGDDSTTSRMQIQDNNDIWFETVGAERMRIDSSGLVTLASMSSNDTRQLTFMGDSNSTSGNGGAIGMFADETRITSNWYYNSGQQKYVAGNGQAVIGLSTGTTDAASFIGFGVNGPADSAGPTLRMKITSAGVVQVENTASAHLILNGDTNNSGDTGQADSIIDFRGDGNPGLYGYRINTENWSGQTALNFQEYINGSYTSRLFISKTGNVGIGTTSPASTFGFSKTLEIQGAANAEINISQSDSGKDWSLGITNGANYQQTTSGQAYIWESGGTERMRITSGGDVLFRGTSVPSASNLIGSGFKFDSKSRMTLVQASDNNNLTDLQEYFNTDGAVGKIQTNGTATLFTTSSDYRLKEDLQEFNGLDKVSNIKVYDFKWKTNGRRSFGVMAHELQEVLPQAVGGKKDAIKENGEINTQTVDYSKIVPLLVKSIQELKVEIELLKSK